MQLEIAVMAEAANMTADGKLNVLGVFGRINSPSVPFTFPQMTLVLKFIASPGEKGMNPGIKVVLVGEDGAVVLSTPEMPAPIPSDTPDLKPEINIIAALQGLTFPKFGAYSFDILVNGSSVKQIPLIVQAVPPPS